MRIARAPHAWNLTPSRAAEVQRELASLVRDDPPGRPLLRVVGVDCAFPAAGPRRPAPLGSECIAAAVVWDIETGRAIEQRIARRPLQFPYVPGLLSFRELPAVLAALRKVESPVDAVFADAHGRAHPRRFGLACHLGVLCDLPCVGVAKSLLVGEHDAPGDRRGDRAPLRDRGDRIGTALRTRDATRPIFVSVGHRIDLETAEELVLACGAGFRVPEPTRLADGAVAAARAGTARPA